MKEKKGGGGKRPPAFCSHFFFVGLVLPDIQSFNRTEHNRSVGQSV